MKKAAVKLPRFKTQGYLETIIPEALTAVKRYLRRNLERLDPGVGQA